MKGIAVQTEPIIEQASRLDCLKGWTLVGGTALAIQLGHRQPWGERDIISEAITTAISIVGQCSDTAQDYTIVYGVAP